MKDNLMPIEEVNSRRTPEQHSADSRKAGIASGISRRRKSICNKLLNNQITDEEAREQLKASGIEENEMTELALSMYELLGTTKNKKEKTRDRLLALEMFMKYAESDSLQEEQTMPELNIKIVDNSDLEKYMYNKE